MSHSTPESTIHDKATYSHHPNGNDNNLQRQITLQLNADQYERLFFQPNAAKGDLAKRLGNPTLLGLLGFLIPFSATVFSLLDFQGSGATSLTSLSGSFYYFGGIAMVLAGAAEFILGNTFPMVVFIIYGAHWVNLGYIYDPLHTVISSYTAGALPGALSQSYNAGQGNYNVVMAIVSFVFLLGSLRINVPFVVVFLSLVFLFSFFAAGSYQLGFNPTVEGLDHALYYFKIGGGFGFVAMMMGWYLAIITACASTGVPCPLPVFDLSQKVFPNSTDAQKGEHAGAVTEHSA